jgi:5-methylthioadenosine/S-adenosylhomocysteine deaminase
MTRRGWTGRRRRRSRLRRAPHLDGVGDPVAVMVLGAGPADVETVIVGGDVVKRDGKLAGDNVGHALDLMHATRAHLRA